MTLSVPFKIGAVEIKNRLILAPMAGYTDAAMRALCARSGAGLTVTEMVSAKGLCFSPDKCESLLFTDDSESVKCVQLFGSEPEYFEKALISPLLDKFDIIDINMGCPVPKIIKNGEGSALLNDLTLAKEIVSACVKDSKNRPVTVKTRLGFKSGEDKSIKFCSELVKEGAQAITLHGRTKEQGYSGVADWEAIKRLSQALSVPVIGSGDINDENANERSDYATALMIGRSAVGDSQIFSRILGEKSSANKTDLLLKHYDLMQRFYGEHYAHVNIRHHIGGYLKGMRGQKEIKLALFSAPTPTETRKILLSINR